MSEKTLGENRVRVDFNVSRQSDVDDITYGTADLINRLEGFKTYKAVTSRPLEFVGDHAPVKHVLANHSEQLRCIALAQTAYEEAAMWAEKAATFKL